LHCARHFKLSCFVEILSFDISASFDLMAGEKKFVDPALSEFYEAMERTNAEKIAHETLARISEGSSDIEDFVAESENEVPKIGPGGEVMLSLESQRSNKDRLMP
jgi:hypothetical protein